MTTMTCVSNIFNSNTADKTYFTWKNHIHAKKWTKAKPNFEHFIKEIKQYGTTLDKIKDKKSKTLFVVILPRADPPYIQNTQAA